MKLSDNYTSSAGAASASVGASSLAVYNCYSNRAPISHASSATTYGIGTASNYGHIKLTDSYTSSSAASNGIGVSSKCIYNLWKATSQIASGTMSSSNGDVSVLVSIQNSQGIYPLMYLSWWRVIYIVIAPQALESDTVSSYTTSSDYITYKALYSTSTDTTFKSVSVKRNSEYNFTVKILLSGSEGGVRVCGFGQVNGDLSISTATS